METAEAAVEGTTVAVVAGMDLAVCVTQHYILSSITQQTLVAVCPHVISFRAWNWDIILNATNQYWLKTFKRLRWMILAMISHCFQAVLRPHRAGRITAFGRGMEATCRANFRCNRQKRKKRKKRNLAQAGI